MHLLGLQPGDRFLYLFDFGDNHEFEVAVESIGKAEKRQRYPRVVRATGGNLMQHPDYDEEEEGEEEA